MTVVAVEVAEGDARDPEEVCFLVEEIVTTLEELLKFASPLPTWMEISAVFLSAALSG
jgi:hypothetical protein